MIFISTQSLSTYAQCVFYPSRPDVDGRLSLEERVVHHGRCRAQLCCLWRPYAAAGSYQEAQEKEFLR